MHVIVYKGISKFSNQDFCNDTVFDIATGELILWLLDFIDTCVLN